MDPADCQSAMTSIGDAESGPLTVINVVLYTRLNVTQYVVSCSREQQYIAHTTTGPTVFALYKANVVQQHTDRSRGVKE